MKLNVKGIVKRASLVAAACIALGSAGAARAQVVPFFQPVQVGPGIFRPAVPQEVFLPPRAFMARVYGSFTLVPAGEEEESEQVTRAWYTANNAAITLVPQQGRSLRLIGSIEVETTTTVDDEGKGTIAGSLTFYSRNAYGVASPVFTAGLNGVYGEGAGPLEVSGGLSLPAANPYDRDVSAAVQGTLSSNSMLASTLNGLAEVVIQ